MGVRWLVGIPAVVAVSLSLAAGPARAGGFATVELSSTPDGARAGQPWVVDLTILQHGRTPLAGLQPTVRIVERESGRSERFAARPTGEDGVYRAVVEFPSPGKWEYLVDDGFTQVHSYPAVRIGERAAVAAGDSAVRPAASDGPRAGALVAAVLAGLVAAGVAFAALGRRRHRHGHPAASPA